jgi:hypothetical protein
MTFTNITLEKRDLIGTLTLNRPEKLNAMTPGLIAEMGEALTAIEQDPEIKVVIVRGAGRAFCTGYDLTVGLSDSRGERYTLDDDQRLIATLCRTLAATSGSAEAGYLHGAWLLPRRRIATRHLHGHYLRGGKREYRFSVDSRWSRLRELVLELDGRSSSHQVPGISSGQPNQWQRS